MEVSDSGSSQKEMMQLSYPGSAHCKCTSNQ